MVHNEYILIDANIASKQKNPANNRKTKAKNGDNDLKKVGCTQSINSNVKIKNTTIFPASRFLYFSQPKITPPTINPIKAKERAHKKYIISKEIALLGKI